MRVGKNVYMAIYETDPEGIFGDNPMVTIARLEREISELKSRLIEAQERIIELLEEKQNT